MRPTNSKTGTYIIQGAKRDAKKGLLLVMTRVTERDDLAQQARVWVSADDESLLRQRIRARNPHGMAAFVGTKVRVTFGSDGSTATELLPVLTMTDAVRDIVKKEIIQPQAR